MLMNNKYINMEINKKSTVIYQHNVELIVQNAKVCESLQNILDLLKKGGKI